VFFCKKNAKLLVQHLSPDCILVERDQKRKQTNQSRGLPLTPGLRHHLAERPSRASCLRPQARGQGPAAACRRSRTCRRTSGKGQRSGFFYFFVAIIFQINHFINRWRFGQMWLFVLFQEHNTDMMYQCRLHWHPIKRDNYNAFVFFTLPLRANFKHLGAVIPYR
jgi:hypothetical protein